MANCQAVILSVEDDTGHRIIIEDLLEATRSPEVGMRQAAAIILNIYCSRSKADYTSHLRSLVSGLIRLFNDSSPVVLEESWDALNAITKVRGCWTTSGERQFRAFLRPDAVSQLQHLSMCGQSCLYSSPHPSFPLLYYFEGILRGLDLNPDILFAFPWCLTETGCGQPAGPH